MTTTASITRQDLAASIPQLDGTVRLAGLHGPVEVVRDSLGVPHIKAGSVHDAFFGQGFVHAQDRLWHMEYDRRRAPGPLGRVRRAGRRRPGRPDAPRPPRREREGRLRRPQPRDPRHAGRLQRRHQRLHPEHPRPPHRVPPARRHARALGALALLRRLQGPTRPDGLVRQQALAPAGSSRPSAPSGSTASAQDSGDDSPLVVPPGATYQDVPDGIGESIGLTQLILGLGDVDGGSNNWVVHGSRTASGKPLLAGDPHRAIDVPNVYYQNHLTCPEFDAIGYSFVGSPSITHFGHNAHVAWGVTTAQSDSKDFFVEKFKPGDPSQYEYKGEWLKADTSTETISVRGARPRRGRGHRHPPRPDRRRRSEAGPRPRPRLRLHHRAEPLVRRAPADAPRHAPSPSWTRRSGPGSIPTTTSSWPTPAATSATSRAARSRSARAANAWLPVPGWTGEYEWTGLVPFEEMPRARNPEQGFIATANQRIVGPDFPHYISLDYAPPAPRRPRQRPPAPADRRHPRRHADRPRRQGLDPEPLVRQPGARASSRSTPPPGGPRPPARLGRRRWGRTASPPPSTPSGARRSRQAILANPLFAPLAAVGGKWDLQPNNTAAARPAAPQRLLRPARPARHLGAAARRDLGVARRHAPSPAPSPGSPRRSAPDQARLALGRASTAPGRATRSRTPSPSTPSFWIRHRSASAATATRPRTAPSPARTPATTPSRPAR